MNQWIKCPRLNMFVYVCIPPNAAPSPLKARDSVGRGLWERLPLLLPTPESSPHARTAFPRTVKPSQFSLRHPNRNHSIILIRQNQSRQRKQQQNQNTDQQSDCNMCKSDGELDRVTTHRMSVKIAPAPAVMASEPMDCLS